MLDPWSEQMVVNTLIGKSEKESKEGRIFTGFNQIDKSTGGLHLGSAYLLAGIEKCGKTSWLLNVVDFNLSQGVRVGYLSTEMSIVDITTRLVAIRGIKVDELELKRALKIEMQNNLSYAGIDNVDLCVNNVLNLGKTLEQMRLMVVEDKCKFLIYDNLTTFSTQGLSGMAGWEVLSGAITKLINLARELNVPLMMVVHVKESTVFKETRKNLLKAIRESTPEVIFRDSVTLVSRPTLGDVFGGGASHSQLSGTFLVWRPYMKFDNSEFRAMSAVILDSQRYSESGVDVRFLFNEKTGKWSEDSIPPEKQVSTFYSSPDGEVQDNSWSQMATNVFEGKGGG